jgi:hypothetical protein
MDQLWHLHGQFMLPIYLPWINRLFLLEADLENMGATQGQIFPLAGQP